MSTLNKGKLSISFKPEAMIIEYDTSGSGSGSIRHKFRYGDFPTDIEMALASYILELSSTEEVLAWVRNTIKGHPRGPSDREVEDMSVPSLVKQVADNAFGCTPNSLDDSCPICLEALAALDYHNIL